MIVSSNQVTPLLRILPLIPPAQQRGRLVASGQTQCADRFCSTYTVFAVFLSNILKSGVAHKISDIWLVSNTRRPGKPGVMVNFMCQLAWAKECLGRYLNIFSGYVWKGVS